MGGEGRKLGCSHVIENVNFPGTGIFGDKCILWYLKCLEECQVWYTARSQ